MERSAAVVWGTVEYGFARLCKVPFWQGGAEQSEVRYARLLCGDVLYAVAKFGPVKHCYVVYAEALLWPGEVRLGQGGVLHGMARCARALFGIVMHGTVESGFARLRAVGQGLVSLRWSQVRNGGAQQGKESFASVSLRLGCLLQRVAGSGFPFLAKALLRSGVEKQGIVLRGAATCSTVRRSLELLRLGLVVRGPARLCPVKYGMAGSHRGLARSCKAVRAGAKLGAALRGNLRYYFGLVMQGGVQLCTARYSKVLRNEK